MRLIHLTDPHLSSLEGMSWWRVAGKRKLGYLSWTRRRQHLHRREALARVVDDIAQASPDIIAVTGDLVQLGLPAEIEQAREWLDEISRIAPLTLVPGNHDIYRGDALANVRELWAPYLALGFGDESGPFDAGYPTSSQAGEVALIGLTSASPQPFWSAGGDVGRAQLDRLQKVLERTTDNFRCVLIHHPPLPAQCAPRKALRDADELTEHLERGQVELVLHGHIHRDRATVHGGRMRVFATASASNTAPDARAAYRMFDIQRSHDQWQVDTTHRRLNAALSGLETVDESAWSVPLLAL